MAQDDDKMAEYHSFKSTLHFKSNRIGPWDYPRIRFRDTPGLNYINPELQIIPVFPDSDINPRRRMENGRRIVQQILDNDFDIAE